MSFLPSNWSLTLLLPMAFAGCSEPAHSSTGTTGLIALSSSGAVRSGQNGSPEALRTFMKIREKLSRGDIAGAAALTTDPDTFTNQMQRYFDRVGEDVAKSRFGNSAETYIRRTMADGNYAVVIVELAGNRYSPVGAQFFQRGSDGTFKQLVSSTLDVPCSLVRTFYEEKGEPEANFACAK